MSEQKKPVSNCEYCSNLVYDDELGEYICEANLDEDDVYRLFSNREFNCPYFRDDDDYKLARKQ